MALEAPTTPPFYSPWPDSRRYQFFHPNLRLDTGSAILVIRNEAFPNAIEDGLERKPVGAAHKKATHFHEGSVQTFSPIRCWL